MTPTKLSQPQLLEISTIASTQKPQQILKLKGNEQNSKSVSAHKRSIQGGIRLSSCNGENLEKEDYHKLQNNYLELMDHMKDGEMRKFKSIDRKIKRRNQIIENEISKQQKLVQRKYEFIGESILKDQKLNQMVLFGKSNFSDLKNFEELQMENPPPLSQFHNQTIHIRGNSFDDRQMIMDDYNIGLKKSSIDKFKMIGLKQFVQTKILNLPNGGGGNINVIPKKIKDQRRDTLHKILSPRRKKSKYYKQQQAEELKELLLKNSKDNKGYVLSTLYKKTYDKRALQMIKPLNITEVLVPQPPLNQYSTTIQNGIERNE